jgi:MFS family permease
VHLYENVLPPLFPLLMVFFNTDYFHLGLVVTIFSHAFGLGSLPAGFLADRIGPRRLVTIYLFGSGVLAVFIWFSGTLITYALLMGLLGLFCSIYHPAANTMISHAIRRKGEAFGIHGIAGSLGVAVAPVFSAWIGSSTGWKAPHVLLGLFGVCIGFFSLTLRTRTPVSTFSQGNHPPEGEPPRAPYLHFIIFFISALALGMSYKGIMTFLPTYMGQKVSVRLLGLDSVSMGGAVATLALLSGALGQYFAGRMVDRHQPEKIYFTVVALGTVFVFMMAMSSGLTLVLSAILYAFLYFSTQPTQNFILSKYTPRSRQGFVFGLHFFLTFGVGSTAAAVSGYLADHLGLTSVFYAMGGCFATASVLLLWLTVRTAGHTHR